MVRVETRDRNLCCVPSFNWSDLFMAGIRHFSSSWETEAMPVAFFSVFSFVGLYFTPHRGLGEEILFCTDYESPVDSGRKAFPLILT